MRGEPQQNEKSMGGKAASRKQRIIGRPASNSFTLSRMNPLFPSATSKLATRVIVGT